MYDRKGSVVLKDLQEDHRPVEGHHFHNLSLTS